MTVLSLMLFHLGAPGDDTSILIGARLIDTALGAALALLLRTVLWPHATLARVSPRQSRAIGAIGGVLADTDLGWPITVAIEELAYIAHSVPAPHPAPAPRDAYTFLTALHQLTNALTDRAIRFQPVPALPGYPRTTEALSSLNIAIADARR